MEGLRTDQLFLWGTPIAVSQLLSAAIVIVAVVLLVVKRTKLKKG
jgi:phosphatidylglycerol:prolipoprotein diacylglycerol transferase